MELPTIFISAITGFLSGLLLSIPVGPVNLTIMNEGARCGFRYAALISAGALVMEVIYCSLAFTGFASFFSHGILPDLMEVFTFGFLLFLGIKFLTSKNVRTATPREMRFEAKLNPTSGFMTGFVRVMGNVGVFLFWIVLAGVFYNHGWVNSSLTSKSVCVLGVAVGTGLWFFGLAYAVSRGHKKFSEITLLRMERGSGIGLLALALYRGCTIAYRINQSHPFLNHHF